MIAHKRDANVRTSEQAATDAAARASFKCAHNSTLTEPTWRRLNSRAPLGSLANNNNNLEQRTKTRRAKVKSISSITRTSEQRTSKRIVVVREQHLMCKQPAKLMQLISLLLLLLQSNADKQLALNKTRFFNNNKRVLCVLCVLVSESLRRATHLIAWSKQRTIESHLNCVFAMFAGCFVRATKKRQLIIGAQQAFLSLFLFLWLPFVVMVFYAKKERKKISTR